jgi:uncharacterized protein YcbK (DUF882 family)
MGDLSKHFNRSEFACKCGCGKNTVDAELVEVLEHLRSVVAEPITITSGNRCPTHNKKVGGSPASRHQFSIAADFKVKGWKPEEVYALLDEWYDDKYGLGLYSGWVHLDVRPEKARW